MDNVYVYGAGTAGRESKKKEDSAMEMEKELEGRLTILRSRLEEQAAQEAEQLAARNQEEITRLNENYEKNLSRFAQEIVERITEV